MTTHEAIIADLQAQGVGERPGFRAAVHLLSHSTLLDAFARVDEYRSEHEKLVSGLSGRISLNLEALRRGDGSFSTTESYLSRLVASLMDSGEVPLGYSLSRLDYMHRTLLLEVFEIALGFEELT